MYLCIVRAGSYLPTFYSHPASGLWVGCHLRTEPGDASALLATITLNTIAVLLHVFHTHRHCCCHIRLKSFCPLTTHSTQLTSLPPTIITPRSFPNNLKPARSLASLWQHRKISTHAHGTSLPSYRLRAQEQVKLTASLLSHHVRHAFAARAGHQEERILLRHPRPTRTPASPQLCEQRSTKALFRRRSPILRCASPTTFEPNPPATSRSNKGRPWPA
jgi:hypothetical protein